MIRVDRSLTMLIHRLRRLSHGHDVSGIPVLMYHSISHSSLEGRSRYYQTHTTPENFRMHMRELKRLKYEVIDLHDLPDSFNQAESPENHNAIITFDDGYQDFYDEAYPTLEELNFKATVFLVTEHVGKSSKVFKGKRCLDWVSVRQLSSRGVTFGSHTVTHPILYNLGDDAIEYELKVSKEEIEQNTGKAVKIFSYPYAFPEGDSAFAKKYFDILEKCGYEAAVTTRIGMLKDPDEWYVIPRLPINDFDDQDFLKAKMDGSYNWLRHPQKIKKIIQRGIRTLSI